MLFVCLWEGHILEVVQPGVFSLMFFHFLHCRIFHFTLVYFERNPIKLLDEHFLTSCFEHYSWFLKNNRHYSCYIQTNHIGFICPFHLLQVNWMIKEVTEVSIGEEEGQKVTSEPLRSLSLMINKEYSPNKFLFYKVFRFSCKCVITEITQIVYPREHLFWFSGGA